MTASNLDPEDVALLTHLVDEIGDCRHEINLVGRRLDVATHRLRSVLDRKSAAEFKPAIPSVP